MSMMLRRPASYIFRQLFDAESSTYSYLVGDVATREALLIDPVLEHLERDAKLVKELDLDLRFCLNTHIHADHITSSGPIKRHFPQCKSVLGRVGNELAAADVKLGHGESVAVGSQRFEARRTPGHTEGCVTYLWYERGEDKPIAAFTGDALLYRACGRVDFQGGDATALYEGVWREILALPEDTPLLAAHDYKGFTSSTVEEEKRHNPRLTKSLEEFTKLMNNLNLPPPKKIDVAVPANRRDGLPAAEASGAPEAPSAGSGVATGNGNASGNVSAKPDVVQGKASVVAPVPAAA